MVLTRALNVLIVAYYFPPHGTVCALRPLGFCRHLHRYGWVPRVVSTDAESVYPRCPTEEELLASLSDTLSIERIPYVSLSQTLLQIRERFRRHIRIASTSDGTQETGGQRLCLPSAGSSATDESTMRNLKRLFLDWAFDFPDPQNSWFHQVLRHFQHLAYQEYPDLVFATGSPWTSLLIGRELARRFRVPFVADFRDPWTSDRVHGFISPWLNRKAEKLEAAVCSAADAIVANTEELRVEFQEKYPHLASKFVTITNGYNFVGGSAESTGVGRVSRMGGERFELCHFGNVYGDRNAVSLLQAIMELHQESRVSPSRLIIRFVGAWEISDPVLDDLAKQLEQVGLFRREPPISHQLCLQEMALADALLILQPHSAVRIPAKTYESIASGRPIILIGEEGAASHLIERHRLGKWCRNSVPSIKTMLEAILDRTTRIETPTKADVERFDYKVLTGRLADVFNKVVARHTR